MGVSGLGVATLAAGSLLIYSGIRNAPVLEALRDIAAGRAPAAHPAAPIGVTFSGSQPGGGGTPATGVATGVGTGTGSGGGNAAIADAARRYLGRPYVWAGVFANGGGGDCSGLVYRALNDVGIHVSRLITTGFLVWTGATTIRRDQCAAGDLVCWSSHMGIAVDRDNMIHAPTFGEVVKISRIWGSPAPTIRRVIMPGATSSGLNTVTV